MADVVRGDPEARREFARRMGVVGRILAVRNARMGHPLTDEELADLTQDTLLRIWKKLADFSGRATLETWVYRFCFLELMNAVRRKSGAQVRTSGEDVILEPAAPPARGEQDIETYVKHLAPREADVVRLRHVEDLSFQEAGEVLGISSSSAKTHYYRALEKLRDVLGTKPPPAREVAE